MGLFRRIKEPIEGTAQIVAASGMPEAGTVMQRCNLHLVVSVPGREPYPVETSDIVRAKKWPVIGTHVPVTVDGRKPERVEIDWDRVPTRDELARQQSQQIAQGGFPGVVVQGAPGQPGAPVDPEQLLDSLGLGALLDGAGGDGPTVMIDGQVVAGDPGKVADAVQRARAGSAADAGDDRIAALERLVALRDAGALTPEEFEAEKARVLGG